VNGPPVRVAKVLDLASADFVRDPYPAYECARAAGSVVRLEQWDSYAVLGRPDCARVLGDDETFDAAGQPVMRALQHEILRGARSWTRSGLPRMPSGPAFHAQRMQGRRTTGRGLTSPGVDDLWPRLEESCRRHSAAIADVSTCGPVDLVRDYAVPVVTEFLAGLLAIDADGLTALRPWVESGYESDADPDARPAWQLLSRLALDRLRRPEGDFLGTLVAGPGTHRSDAPPLTAHLEFVVSTALMISRVTHQGLVLSFSTLMNALLEHPAQYARLRRNLHLVAAAVEEGLRYDSSTQALGRLTRTEAEIAGTVVPPGSLLILFIGAANRDPAIWARPDTFDLTRPTAESSRHLAFGHGSSSCLGAGMSRRVLSAMLTALLGCFTEMCADTGRRWLPEFATRGLTALPAWAAAASFR
jgi:cytochrome P450